MGTLSLLRDIQEFETVKIRQLPIPEQKELHKDFEWIKDEFIKWSKQFSFFNERVDNMVVDYVCKTFVRCDDKERVLGTTKIVGFFMSFVLLLLPAREKRSASEVEKVVNHVVKTLKTGISEEGFVLGKRLEEILKHFKKELNEDQLNVFETSLELTYKSYSDVYCNYCLKNKVIPLKDHFELMSKESRWNVYLLLIEYCAGVVIPADIRRKEVIQTFSQKAVELVLAIDDYYMTQIKLMTDYSTARTACLLNEKKCTLQVAVDNQFEYTMDLYKLCSDLRDSINSNSEVASEGVRVWMDIIFDMFHVVGLYIKETQQVVINDDQTLRSDLWDQTYAKLRSKESKFRADPYLL